MKTVIQRVSQASVSVDNQTISAIQKGLLILLGIEHDDSSEDVAWLTKKISQLRIFDDSEGVMNESVASITGDVIVVSQFTLHARTKKGNRPSYIQAARPEQAVPLYEEFVESLHKKIPGSVYTGKFGHHMDIDMCNDGPVTIIIDSKNKI
ncbi:MAG: D-aminoacyl-tRNA deacylase [Bacteroidales bacterium]|jgi:D-tyrosyl-tRNA(Tyr) deacylase|nr:D-aminoacyl-tRNA deacylase [Bacteroidales bacterium]